jgi:hypothetical protein
MTNGIRNARMIHESFPIVHHESRFESALVALASPGKVHSVGREKQQPPTACRSSP